MKTVIVYTFLFSVIFLQALSQTRIGAGINYLALDAPDDMVWMPRLYAEQQLRSRLSVDLGVGYINRNDYYDFSIIQPPTPISIPENRKRIAIDVTLKYALIKKTHHQFAIGVGPSVWYRNDLLTKAVRWRGTDYSYDQERTENWRAGINTGIEYSYSDIRRNTYKAHFQIVPLALQGLNPNIGLSYLYRIR